MHTADGGPLAAMTTIGCFRPSGPTNRPVKRYEPMTVRYVPTIGTLRVVHRDRRTPALQSRNTAFILFVLILLPPATAVAQSTWTDDPQVRQRLRAGEVVVAAGAPTDPEHPRGLVQAAVRIAAPPEAIWRVLTDCQQAITYVPGLRVCHRIDGAPDGSWADIEHVVHYSWMLPTVRYVFRAEYQRPHRIDFHRVSGDLKEEQGTWLLTPSPDAGATVVQYEVYIDPGFWIPQFLVHRSLRKDLPAALNGLRERVEAEDGHANR